MPEPFGSFGWICRHTVLPQCNLFFAQLYNRNTDLATLFPSSSDLFSPYNVVGHVAHHSPLTPPLSLTIQTTSSVTDDTNVMAAKRVAGTGVAESCGLKRVGQGSNGDIAVSLLVAAGLSAHATRRRAAVGRVELRMLVVLFGVLCALQIVDMASLLEQGIIVVSAIHTALFSVFCWILLGNALVATQIVEDGTLAALVPLCFVAVLFFVPTLYISLSVGFGWNETFFISSSDPAVLKSTALFVLSLLWPAVAIFAYVVVMLWVIIVYLAEIKPALCFAGAQLVFFLAAQPICTSSSGKVNSAFLATMLDTFAITALYASWLVITEEDWTDEPSYDVWA